MKSEKGGMKWGQKNIFNSIGRPDLAARMKGPKESVAKSISRHERKKSTAHENALKKVEGRKKKEIDWDEQ